MAALREKSKPLKVALAGAGMISWYHLVGWRNLGERVRVVAVADPDAASAAKRAGEVSIPHVYRDPDDQLAADAIDAFDVPSPRQPHAALVEAGAPRCIDVLCHKPLASTLPDAAARVSRDNA